MSTYKIIMFDERGHLYTSSNVGETWAYTTVPSGGLPDIWSDMYMAINDGDYTTVSLYAVGSSVLAFGRGGVEVADIALGNSATESILDYSYGTADVNYQGAYSGAVSAGGRNILVPPFVADDLATSYPRLTTNFGGTWADVTALGTGSKWTRACFSQNAAIMYIHKAEDYISKSDDSGATWTALASGPTFAAVHTSTVPGDGENGLRMRCSQDGSVVAATNQFGEFYVSPNGGTTWTNTNFYDLISSDWQHTSQADFGMSIDGAVMFAAIANNKTAGTGSYFFLSTDSGANWTQISNVPTRAQTVVNVNITPDAAAVLVAYGNGPSIALVDVSTDQGATWTARTFDISGAVGANAGDWVSVYILPASSVPVTPTGDPGGGDLIGATYRRVSAFATETPAFVGWHRHDFGHARTLTSIGVSGDTGGLLDNLDMVTTDGTNTYVEGFTQIFDEDDDLTDGWFLDGALVPDSAYEDTPAGITGIRFTGLWYLRTQFVTVCAFGLDLGDFTVGTDGTLFVPYGSGTAPSLFDYTSAGAGAYLFTAAYITANVQATAPRNGGVFISSGYMPVVVGYTFVSDGQTLRPAAQEQVGTRTGSPFGQKRRSHYVKALLRNTIGLQFGTDFGMTLQAAKLADDAGTQPTPTQPYSGLWRETLNDDYTFDSMLSWRIVRPYPASVVSIGASVEGQDA